MIAFISQFAKGHIDKYVAFFWLQENAKQEGKQTFISHINTEINLIQERAFFLVKNIGKQEAFGERRHLHVCDL